MDIDDSFGLDIDLAWSEHSRDFRSNSYDVRVDGTRVQLGHLGSSDDSSPVAFELSDEQGSELRSWLQQYDLCESVDETFDIDPDGPYREIDVVATAEVDGDTYDLRIEGVTSVRGEQTDMEYRTRADRLQWLCRQFDRWFREARADP